MEFLHPRDAGELQKIWWAWPPKEPCVCAGLFVCRKACKAIMCGTRLGLEWLLIVWSELSELQHLEIHRLAAYLPIVPTAFCASSLQRTPDLPRTMLRRVLPHSICHFCHPNHPKGAMAKSLLALVASSTHSTQRKSRFPPGHKIWPRSNWSQCWPVGTYMAGIELQRSGNQWKHHQPQSPYTSWAWRRLGAKPHGNHARNANISLKEHSIPWSASQ